MVLNQVDPKLILDPDNSTVYTATTPPETVATNLLDDHDPFGDAKSSYSSVPWPGSTFIIRCVSSGHVITLLDGQIVLAPPGGRGSIHWACVETKGWFGFRNHVSGWENFCVRMRPEGGYVLLMTHFETLWHVGIKVEQEVEKLAKIEYKGSDGIVWEFVEV
ncbi:MAG: hypothetical protein M1816_004022 [Peltula sp. TS41687]|nr:MAG: hypothetical protein M1816_004022 [Peltula sp. TS41687]